MFESIEIRNFRAFAELDIEGLRRINLLVGRNNTGKTSVLEAIFLLCGATNPIFPSVIGQLRGQKMSAALPDGIWRPLYHDLEKHVPIEIVGHWCGEKSPRSLQISALEVSEYSADWEPPGGVVSTDEGPISGLRLRYRPATGDALVTEAMFDPATGSLNAPAKQRSDFARSAFVSARTYPSLSRDAEQLSFLVKIKQEQQVANALAAIDPSIQRLEVVAESGTSTVYADTALPALVPLAVCGEGTVRLFSIVVQLTGCRGGVLLVDEIDSGLHHSVMERLWGVLHQMAAKHDVQIIATTHNDEIIHSAIRALTDDCRALGLFRLDKVNGHHSVTSYDETALRAVERENFEVRG